MLVEKDHSTTQAIRDVNSASRADHQTRHPGLRRPWRRRNGTSTAGGPVVPRTEQLARAALPLLGRGIRCDKSDFKAASGSLVDHAYVFGKAKDLRRPVQ